MQGDFTAYSFEQFAGILDGLVLAKEFSKAILSDPLVMFPFLILIWIYGLFWWSMRIKTFTDLTKFLAWLLGITILYAYISLSWNVKVLFNPSYGYSVSIAHAHFKILELAPIIKNVESSSSVLLFSLPDKLANFFYEFAMVKLRFTTKNVSPTVEINKCINPDSVYAEGLLLGFRSYLNNSVGTFKDVNEFIETVRECTWELGESIKYDPIGSVIYVIGRKIRGVDAKCDEFGKHLVEGLKKTVSECKSLMGDKFNERVFENGIALCIDKKVKACRDLFDKFIETADKLDRIVWSSPIENIKLFPVFAEGVQRATADLASKASQWYASYLTKWKVTLKVNGILLGILLGFSPLILIFSMIPIGNSSINWKLFIGSLFAYFLIKLWIPVLYIVHYFAYHTLGFNV